MCASDAVKFGRFPTEQLVLFGIHFAVSVAIGSSVGHTILGGGRARG